MKLQWLAYKFTHRASLLRAAWLRLLGAELGKNVSIGRLVDTRYADALSVGRDVSIDGPSTLYGPEGSIRIGSDCSIDCGAWIVCGARGHFGLGDGSYIGCYCVMGAGGGIDIGDGVLIGQHVSMHSENHIFSDRDKEIREQGVESKGIVVENDVWIGSGAIVLDGVRVGKGAVVAAGSVVTRDVAPYTVVAGVPARQIGTRGSESEQDVSK